MVGLYPLPISTDFQRTMAEVSGLKCSSFLYTLSGTRVLYVVTRESRKRHHRPIGSQALTFKRPLGPTVSRRGVYVLVCVWPYISVNNNVG